MAKVQADRTLPATSRSVFGKLTRRVRAVDVVSRRTCKLFFKLLQVIKKSGDCVAVNIFFNPLSEPQQEQDSRAICSRPEASSNHLSATWKAMYVGLLVGLTFMMICFWRASILSTFEAEVLLAPSGCGINSESDGENQSQRKGRGFLGLTRASLVSLLCVASCLTLAIAGWPLLSLRYGRSP